jgi:quinoprotein glucose dehydrogenase
MAGVETRARFSLRRASQMVAAVAIVAAATRGVYDALSVDRPRPGAAGADWPSYGRDPGGSRYSPLARINRANVNELEVAWVYRTGDWSDGSDGRQKSAFQCTPIVVDGVMYVCTMYGRVIALDPETGVPHWTFDPQMDRSVDRSEIGTRGVATWVEGALPDGDPARRRIYVATRDARLIALNAQTGRACADFGASGVVDLSQGVDLDGSGVREDDYGVTSAPAVIGDVIVVGSAVGDNRAVTVERGVVRAFDARSGALVWLFDPIPRDPTDAAWETWGDESAAVTGAGNVWGPISVDPERDLVFVPTSSPSPDYYGGNRRGANVYCDSVVALRGTTGEVVWHYQIVHHDLWDYDLPAQPTLLTVHKNGREIPAVAQATKMGMLFLLDRETGEPIFPVEERPVPVSDVSGEASWPTQPFPTVPPPLATATATPDDAWGLTPWDRRAARDLIERYRYEGIYTPPSLQGSIEFPGIAGGTNWGGVAFQPERGLVVLNMSHIPFVIRLHPRDGFDLEAARSFEPGEYALQLGTPYIMGRWPLLSPFGLPCTKPPWGTLAAVDLGTGRVKWEVPLGTTRDIAPIPLPLRLGVPNMGGPMVTGGDLVFIGAASDNYIRAFDVETGDELWKRRLPAGGQATPMTFCLPGSGEQYVVIAAGGHGKLDTTIGDYVVAFRLRNRGAIAVLWLLDAMLAVAVVYWAAGFLFPVKAGADQAESRIGRWRRRTARLLGAILWLAAVGLVAPGLLDGQTWLTPISAITLTTAFAVAALANLVRGRFRPLAAGGVLLLLAAFLTYSQMSELFWVGVLPW